MSISIIFNFQQNGSLSIKVRLEQDSMKAIGFDLGWYPFDSQMFENMIIKAQITGMKKFIE